MSNVTIEITEHAQRQIRDAIKWRSHHEDVDTARAKVKSTIVDWKDQLETFPECGKSCQYFDSDEFRELNHGDYRFVYEIRQEGKQFNIYLLIFCHEKMDYETLIRQFSHF